MTVPRDQSDALTEISALFDPEADAAPPPARTRRWRGPAVVLTVFALLATAVGGYVVWALSAPLPAATLFASAPEPPTTEPVTLAMPTRAAAAVVVTGFDESVQTGGTMSAAVGGSEPRPIASIAKLVTALTILDAYPIAPNEAGPTITFGKAAHDLYDDYYVRGATIVPMPTGITMSLRDALSVMLIPSASNYADALATWAFGSTSGYLGAARDWLSEQGLDDTVIVDPTGISPANTATPEDLLALARIASGNPVVAEIASTTSFDIRGIDRVQSTNALLGVDGVTGLKTGNLGMEQFNLLFTAQIDAPGGQRLDVVGVILGGSTRASVDGNVRGMLASIRDGFRQIALTEPRQRVGTVETVWGESSAVVVAGSPAVRVWSDAPIDVELRATAPVHQTAGTGVGELVWTTPSGAQSARVVLAEDIPEPSAWWRLTHPGDLADW
ncbi:D-alanyl-D-alanine carboxypeptidase [Microbacterium marinum]|uniref:D-alanyl-D-alanine carboxypeptidase family protein n=1 Tax=Microbacterium marinum TaxID=421115 RepID=UPI00384E4CA3